MAAWNSLCWHHISVVVNCNWKRLSTDGRHGPVWAPGLSGLCLLHFLAGGHKRHSKAGLSLFCWLMQVFLFLFCVSDVCSVLFPCLWLSVPVQLITSKDSSREITYYVLNGTLNPTHSLTMWWVRRCVQWCQTVAEGGRDEFLLETQRPGWGKEVHSAVPDGQTDEHHGNCVTSCSNECIMR